MRSTHVADGQVETVVLRTRPIRGRIAKPGVTIVLGRYFRAHATLMSEDLWREQTRKIAAGRR